MQLFIFLFQVNLLRFLDFWISLLVVEEIYICCVRSWKKEDQNFNEFEMIIALEPKLILLNSAAVSVIHFVRPYERPSTTPFRISGNAFLFLFTLLLSIW